MKHDRTLFQPFFIHGEACAITDVSTADLNNWTFRVGINLGTMIVGRRVYSIIDLIKLRVIGDLARTLNMKPSFAAAIAESVMPRATQIAALDNNGKLIHRHADDPHYLLAWVEPDKDNFKVARTSEARLVEAVRVPHPVILIPLDTICLETTAKCLKILEHEKSTGVDRLGRPVNV